MADKSRMQRLSNGPKEGQSWQSYKTDSTRERIIDATIACLAELPYSDVSFAVIAARAGVSKGGMQYHFPSRVSLFLAALLQLHNLRLTKFAADIASIPPGVDIIDHVVDTHWKHLNEPEFMAYQELVLASRSDPELKEAILPHYHEFIRRWHEIAQEGFGWDPSRPELRLAGNVSHYIMDGMAYGQLVGQLSEGEVRELLDYVKDVMKRSLGKA